MKTRLSWNIVKEHFSDQWVELADYRWDWGAPYPSWVVVGSHAANRGELLSKIASRTNRVGDYLSEGPANYQGNLEQSPDSSSLSGSTDRLIIYVGATHAMPPILPFSV